MRLLASGRESDIYDLGGGRVLRRYKVSGNPEREAAVIEHARAKGFPVPRVHDVREGELVLERIDGRSLAADMTRRPWRLRAHARLLADLHRRLHAIEAPAGLEAASEGEALVHLDFHPENVLLTRSGPVVIDWTNARRGDPAFDVAFTWVILATSDVDPVGARVGLRLYTRAFVGQFERSELLRQLPAAAERRLRDPNTKPGERQAIRRMSARLVPR